MAETAKKAPAKKAAAKKAAPAQTETAKVVKVALPEEIFDVATKMNRHHWHRHEIPYEEEDWSKIASRFDLGPENETQAREFAAAVAAAVEECLSERQRLVFVATVLNGMPTDVLAEELGSTHNALYKVLYDARKKLRAALVANGYLADVSAARSA